MLIRNWENPTTNTFIGALGVLGLLLRELISMDAFNIRHSLRGLIGSNAEDFNTRLLHVSAGACILGYCAKLD